MLCAGIKHLISTIIYPTVQKNKKKDNQRGSAFSRRESNHTTKGRAKNELPHRIIITVSQGGGEP